MSKKQFRVAIFEDELETAREVARLVKKYAPGYTLVGHANTIEQCKQMIANEQLDLILSDIHFGNDVIFDHVTELKDFTGHIVFISGYNNFAVESFELNAINYILKPITETAFEQMIDRVETSQQADSRTKLQQMISNNLEETVGNRRISFYSKDGLVIKRLSEILYFKSDSNYTEVFFSDQEKLLITKTILHFEKLLHGHGFFRIHQSYLVNLQYLKLFNREECFIQLQDGKTLPVSHRKKSELVTAVNSMVL